MSCVPLRIRVYYILCSLSTLTVRKLESILEEKLSPLNSRIVEISKTIDEAMKNINFISSKYEDVLEKIKSYEEGRIDLINENKSLKAELSMSVNELKCLKESYNELERYSRRKCIILK